MKSNAIHSSKDAAKTDARGQQIVYTRDSLARLTLASEKIPGN
jgi:hypothetical protein